MEPMESKTLRRRNTPPSHGSSSLSQAKARWLKALVLIFAFALCVVLGITTAMLA